MRFPPWNQGRGEELKPYEKNGRVMNFPSYHDGVKYQKTHHLEKSTYVLPLTSKGKRALYCCIKLLGTILSPYLMERNYMEGRE